MFDLLVALCLYNEIVCRQQQIINYAYKTAEFHQIDPNKFLGLISCESRFEELAAGDYRSETGEFMANGILQFWFGSFRTYSKKFKIKGNYLDPFTQIDLAAHIIAYDKKGINNWYNCGKAVGFIETPLLAFKGS